MKAIQISEFGGPEVMRYVEVDDPVLRDGDVLLEVSAIGINYADTHQTEDSYLSKQKLPLIPGIEVVGTYNGKRYLAFVSAGGYAQKAAVKAESLIPIPDKVNDGEALAMAVQGTTAYHIIKTVGHLKHGESVVVHAGAGGVGTLAIQLAKRWGAYVIAVTSNQVKKDLCKELGADVVIDSQDSELTEAIMKANKEKPVDLILEMVGGKTFDQSLQALAPFGRMVTYGMASRIAPSPISSGVLMGTSRTVTGFWLAHCFGKKELINDVISELFSLIVEGSLRVIVGKTYPLSHAAQAHTDMRSRNTLGKIVLDPRV